MPLEGFGKAIEKGNGMEASQQRPRSLNMDIGKAGTITIDELPAEGAVWRASAIAFPTVGNQGDLGDFPPGPVLNAKAMKQSGGTYGPTEEGQRKVDIEASECAVKPFLECTNGQTDEERLKVNIEASKSELKPSSEGAIGLTEEEQLKVKLEEARRQRRRESNRTSAQRCRARKQQARKCDYVNSELQAGALGLTIQTEGRKVNKSNKSDYDTLTILAQECVTVENTMHEVAHELKSAKKRRQLLAAEVKFLNEKRKSFQRALQLDSPSQAALELKSRETPQFYEAKLVDELYSTVMNRMVFSSKRL